MLDVLHRFESLTGGRGGFTRVDIELGVRPVTLWRVGGFGDLVVEVA